MQYGVKFMLEQSLRENSGIYYYYLLMATFFREISKTLKSL